MGRNRIRLIVMALALLALGSCTNANSSDDQRHDGFYGGVGGGITRVP